VKLPKGKHAIVDSDKLRDYCLNPEHRRGGHKACVFKASLGITAEHAEDLRTALQAAAINNDAMTDAHSPAWR
jgi:hypothetical protein